MTVDIQYAKDCVQKGSNLPKVKQNCFKDRYALAQRKMKGNKLKPKSLNLNLFNVNPTQLDPSLDPEGQLDPFEPKNWAENWVEPKKFGQVWPH